MARLSSPDLAISGNDGPRRVRPSGSPGASGLPWPGAAQSPPPAARGWRVQLVSHPFQGRSPTVAALDGRTRVPIAVHGADAKPLFTGESDGDWYAGARVLGSVVVGAPGQEPAGPVPSWGDVVRSELGLPAESR